MRADKQSGGLLPVLIAGPTASGKSALALDLAEELHGIVINADSMQVYRELRILTNRPTPEDEARAPHMLYGFRPAAEPYSAALWLQDVRRALSDATASGRRPIIVGGTGLYFKALTEGLSEIPPIPSAIRDHFREEAKRRPAKALHAELALRDPLTASRLRPSDTQRLVRALEVFEATGRSLAEWQSHNEPPLLPPEKAVCIALSIEREELYARCDRRLDWMVELGAIDEARSIAALGLDASRPAMRAVGVAEFLAYLRRECSLEEAVRLAKMNTRRYAKRQLTWIRGNFKTWIAIYEQEMERTKRVLDILNQKHLTLPS